LDPHKGKGDAGANHEGFRSICRDLTELSVGRPAFFPTARGIFRVRSGCLD